MGWCSGTGVFDPVCKAILELDLDKKQKTKLITVLAKALEEMDWDCQSESDFWEHPLVREVMKKLHKDWDWEYWDHVY